MDLDAPRWRGQPGRLEVWYTTLTDPSTGTGFWLHTERVAPADGSADFVHGWAAAFAPDHAPVWERFANAEPALSGSTASMRWDLRITDHGGPPLWTFPRLAWERELLPAAQVVASPCALYDGTFAVGDQVFDLTAARGASSRIYGHGNAKRWGWLHADLGGGDVLEVVSAVSMRRGLRDLPPLTFLKLRVDGSDHSSPLLRARLELPDWSVTGVLGRHRLDVRVHQDARRTVAVSYTDPDGHTATCHNSELASVVLRWGSRQWRLHGTAHAEIGVRP